MVQIFSIKRLWKVFFFVKITLLQSKTAWITFFGAIFGTRKLFSHKHTHELFGVFDVFCSVFLRYFDLWFRGYSYIITANFRHNLRHEEKNNKKITQAGGVGNQHLPLALNTFLKHNSPIFGTKHLPCRRFLQHYYRSVSILPPTKLII